MTAIVISIISLIVSLIISTRVILLDKEYSEFYISNNGDDNNGLNGGEVFNREIGYTLTILKPKIIILKSDIYDIEISGISKDHIKPYKSNKINRIKLDEIIEFS